MSSIALAVSSDCAVASCPEPDGADEVDEEEVVDDEAEELVVEEVAVVDEVTIEEDVELDAEALGLSASVGSFIEMVPE